VRTLNLNVEEVVKFRDAIRQALENAKDSGYQEEGEWAEDVAINICDQDVEFEVFNECWHLLVPYIQEWQAEQRILKGGK
jgi:hypothetical protein